MSITLLPLILSTVETKLLKGKHTAIALSQMGERQRSKEELTRVFLEYQNIVGCTTNMHGAQSKSLLGGSRLVLFLVCIKWFFEVGGCWFGCASSLRVFDFFLMGNLSC